MWASELSLTRGDGSRGDPTAEMPECLQSCETEMLERAMNAAALSTQLMSDACGAVDNLRSCPSFAACDAHVVAQLSDTRQALGCDNLIELGSDSSDSSDGESATVGQPPPPPPPPSPPPLPSPPPPLTTVTATAFDGYLSGCGARLAPSGLGVRLEDAAALAASATTDASGRYARCDDACALACP